MVHGATFDGQQDHVNCNACVEKPHEARVRIIRWLRAQGEPGEQWDVNAHALAKELEQGNDIPLTVTQVSFAGLRRAQEAIDALEAAVGAEHEAHCAWRPGGSSCDCVYGLVRTALETIAGVKA